MKKKTIIIESVILITSIILLVLFLGLPQWLDLNKRANQQKNISQLTELSIATNNFLDKYMFSMTSDLSRIKEKMEYTQRLNVPGNSKYQYFVYGGMKDYDQRYVVSYDLFDLMSQYSKITDSNKKQFIDAVNAYVITAKQRMLNSPEKDKYKNYLGYLDILTANLNNDNFFIRAQYTRSITNPAFNKDRVSTFASVAQSFVGSELFKERRQAASIILFLAYINQVDYEYATAETFNEFYTQFANIYNFTGYYLNSAGNPIEDGMNTNQVKEMFEKEFLTFFKDSIKYEDRLNKATIAIGTNASDEPDNRLTNEFLEDLANTSYQKEVNQVIDNLLTEYPNNYEGFANALRSKIDEYKENDIDRQLVDIYESVFNYMLYQEYLYKSVYNQQKSFVNSAFDDKFNEYFHNYILKYDKEMVLKELGDVIDKEVASNDKTLLSRFKNNNLLRDFREEMKGEESFLKSFYRSKTYSDIIKEAKNNYISKKRDAFASQVKQEKITIENLRSSISEDNIIQDSEYQEELKNKVAEWENIFSYLNYVVAKDNPNASKTNLSAELLADSLNILKQNKGVIDNLKAKINDAKENYIKSDFSRYNALFSYVDYCAEEIIKTLKAERADEIAEYRDLVVATTNDYITSQETPEFQNELVSDIRNNLNELHKSKTLEFATLSPETLSNIETLNAKLTNHAEYVKYARANRISNSRILSQDEISAFQDVAINPEGLVYFYNFYLFYNKDKIDKTNFYSSFGRSQLQKAKDRYVVTKNNIETGEWESLEEQIKQYVLSDNQEDRNEFESTIKHALKSFRDLKNENYKFENSFNFNGLLSDLARVENNIKFFRGPIEFPFYDKDEFYLIFGRYIEQNNKKIGIAVVSYTDIHNFPEANAVEIRNLGNTNVDIDGLTADLEKQLANLISKYQKEIVKLSQENPEFKNINVIHHNDPDYKITTQTVQAKKIIRERFSQELEEVVEKFVRENY